jgi:hypothetical protein
MPPYWDKWLGKSHVVMTVSGAHPRTQSKHLAYASQRKSTSPKIYIYIYMMIYSASTDAFNVKSNGRCQQARLLSRKKTYRRSFN